MQARPIHSVLVLVAALARSAAAQDVPAGFSLQEVEQLHLDDAVAGADDGRVVELYLRTLTRDGAPIDDLRPTHVSIQQDGVPIDPADVEIRHLEESGRGVAWVIAIDASRTMMGDTFYRARAAAVDLIGRLGPNDRVGIVTFAQHVEVIADFDDPIADARVRLEEIGVDERGFQTRLYDGLSRAIDLIEDTVDRPRRAAVILFSDGKDSGSELDLEEVVDQAQAARALVYGVGYGRFGGAGLAVLEEIAERSGGHFQRVSSSADLQPIFRELRERVMRSYVLRFPAAMDGERHTIEVSIDAAQAALELDYPRLGAPLWPWALAVGGGAGLAFATLAAARLRNPGRLVFEAGPREGEVQALRSGRLRIGAIEANDVVIPSMSVSRHHAELLVVGRRVEILDLQSSNGTEVNGERLHSAPRELAPGDRIRIADVEMVYER